MNKIIKEYGEVIPSYCLNCVESIQGGESIIAYQLFKKGHISIFDFKVKPQSLDRYIETQKNKNDNFGITGWYYDRKKELANFKFSPRIGYDLYSNILKDGYNAEKLSKDGRWSEIDADFYLYQKIAKLIEKKDSK